MCVYGDNFLGRGLQLHPHVILWCTLFYVYLFVAKYYAAYLGTVFFIAIPVSGFLCLSLYYGLARENKCTDYRNYHQLWTTMLIHFIVNLRRSRFYLFRRYCRKTVSEQWCHQVIVNAWTSWIDACHQYILLVICWFVGGDDLTGALHDL